MTPTLLYPERKKSNSSSKPPVKHSPDPLCCYIPLTKGMYAIVDANLYDWLNQWNWHVNHSGGYFYAARGTTDAAGKYQLVLMHRQILGLTCGDFPEGDHALHNTLDNRLFVDGVENLRLAIPKENRWNTKKIGSAKFKGIMYSGMNIYEATLMVDGKLLRLGKRATAEDAFTELYIPAIKKYRGKFANAGSEELNRLHKVGPYSEEGNIRRLG